MINKTVISISSIVAILIVLNIVLISYFTYYTPIAASFNDLNLQGHQHVNSSSTKGLYLPDLSGKPSMTSSTSFFGHKHVNAGIHNFWAIAAMICTAVGYMLIQRVYGSAP
jgi:hypothetical protein